MSERINIPKSTKGKDYVGVWDDGSLGWMLSKFVHPAGAIDQNDELLRAIKTYRPKNERAYLCEITIKPLKDKLGRPITRRPKK